MNRILTTMLTLLSAATLSAQIYTEFPVTAGELGGITTGPDGNLWFTEVVANNIARMTPAGIVTEFKIPASGARPGSIVTGPDGNLWFTEGGRDMIGRITPAGVISQFSLGADSFIGHPVGITAGADGNLWFTETISRLGRMTTNGSVTRYPLKYDRPFGITAGSDGNVWFTVRPLGESKICRITPDGVITQFDDHFLYEPAGIVAGPDGHLWFAQAGINRIGRITTTGVITQFPSPGPSENITVGADGNLWFTILERNLIVRMTTEGVVTGEFTLPETSGFPLAITLGPDRNLWFTQTSGAIGRLSLPEPGKRRRAITR